MPLDDSGYAHRVSDGSSVGPGTLGSVFVYWVWAVAGAEARRCVWIGAGEVALGMLPPPSYPWGSQLCLAKVSWRMWTETGASLELLGP